MNSKEVLWNPSKTKSTGFSRDERVQLGLQGLLPYCVTTLEAQCERALENMRRKETDIEKYIFLNALQDRNETLYYWLVTHNIEEVMPLIYTPTVGQACKEFAHIFRRPKGFYITPEDRGNIRSILDNWPERDVRVIVVTDGERILGLGDLGANGMGIPIGKLALYTACAGIHPSQCLPVMFDVGTNNAEIRSDDKYLGYPGERLSGEAYDELFDEFITACQDAYPKALIQFEDFLTPNAYRLLTTYRDKILCFNDDIQGTAAVVLAGLYSGARATGMDFADMRFTFLGAGSAATGIADLVQDALVECGLDRTAARRRITFVDQYGLLTANRDDLQPHNLPYVEDVPAASFVETIGQHRPHALIGATGAPGTFTQEIIELMAQNHEQPLVFALSNPTSRAECTAEQAYSWSDGKAIFASGSPFDPVELDGEVHRPGQGNNAYIFPGVGLGAVAGHFTRLPESAFLVAAESLAAQVSDQDLSEGALYPPLKSIRDVSLKIAKDLITHGLEIGVSQLGSVPEIEPHLAEHVYEPTY